MRGLCTVLVTKSGAVEDCQSWRIQSRTRELPLAICDVTGTQGSGIRAGIGADSGTFRLWTGIPGIRDCRRVLGSGGTPGVHTGTQDQKSTQHAPGFRSLGVFRECRGECEEEEAEQVQPLRRAVVGHRRSSHCTWALTLDGRSRRSMANVRRSTARPIPFGGRSARCSPRTRCA